MMDIRGVGVVMGNLIVPMPVGMLVKLLKIRRQAWVGMRVMRIVIAMGMFMLKQIMHMRMTMIFEYKQPCSDNHQRYGKEKLRRQAFS